MHSSVRGTAGLVAKFGVLAITAVGAAMLLSPASAVAASGHSAFKATARLSGPIKPGGSGTLRYEVRNVSGKRITNGVLLNVSLPKYVKLNKPGQPLDGHCQKTGTNRQGGDLVSCNFSKYSDEKTPGSAGDGQGTFAVNAKHTANTPLYVDAKAPRGTKLGTLAALVVPLNGQGKPAESVSKLNGPNTVRVDVRTAR